ncbi:MAG: hypothetical protein ABIP35_01130 [Ginsengibacter sp.]
MKKLFFLALVIFLFSCKSEETKTTESTPSAETKAPQTKVDLPYKFAYEGTATIGNPENIKTVMNFNRDFAEGKTENIGSYFADSVHVVFEDGSEINNSRDSAAAMITGWRSTISDVQLSYITAIAVDNKDKGDEWVFQWIDEADNYKDGKKVHHILHEDYRLVKGKIREVFQYSQAIPAPVKK